MCAVVASGGEWMTVGSNVSWGAKDNSYGTFHVPVKVCATKVQFVHKSGYVSCLAGQCSVYHVRVVLCIQSHLRTCPDMRAQGI